MLLPRPLQPFHPFIWTRRALAEETNVSLLFLPMLISLSSALIELIVTSKIPWASPTETARTQTRTREQARVVESSKAPTRQRTSESTNEIFPNKSQTLAVHLIFEQIVSLKFVSTLERRPRGFVFCPVAHRCLHKLESMAAGVIGDDGWLNKGHAMSEALRLFICSSFFHLFKLQWGKLNPFTIGDRGRNGPSFNQSQSLTVGLTVIYPAHSSKDVF